MREEFKKCKLKIDIQNAIVGYIQVIIKLLWVFQL